MRSATTATPTAWVGLCLLLVVVLMTCSAEPDRQESEDATSALPSPPTVEPLVPVLEIAGKTPTEVEEVLGPARSQESVRSRGKRSGEIEIVFVDGRSDWITIFPKGKFAFNEQVLQALGLPQSKATFSNPNAVIRWEAVAGLREVSIFPGKGNTVDYVYILVRTKP